MTLLLIGLSGAAGALLRFAVAGWAQRWLATPFPLGTLVVNTLGCLAIGWLAALFAGPAIVREEYRLALLVGLLGGFTTFSSFGYETLTLLQAGQWQYAILNVVLNNGLGLAAVYASYTLGQR